MRNNFTKKNLYILFALIIMIGILFAYQAHTLRVAHSSFENYYAFRGCVQLIERTDASAKCKLSDGREITIVKVGSRWFLEGDYGW